MNNGSKDGAQYGDAVDLGDNPEVYDKANSTFRYTVTEEWAIEFPGCSEAIRSQLPFRAFLREHFMNYDWAPLLGLGHMATYVVSKLCFDHFH